LQLIIRHQSNCVCKEKISYLSPFLTCIYIAKKLT
jgi:hypothetical protein